MNSKKRSGSGVFLMEMIMVCCFFLLCAAVCIRVFLRSDSMSRLAREKNQAVLAAESLADAWKVYGREGLGSVFSRPAGDGSGGTVSLVCWDKDWKRLEEDDGSGYYLAVINAEEEEETEDGMMESLTVEIGRDKGQPRSRERIGYLFTLQVKRYVPKGGGSHGQK